MQNKERQMLKQKKRVVIKIGSSSLTHPETGALNLLKIERLIRLISDLRGEGREVVLVSSGAIAAGRQALGHTRKPDSLAQKQAYAAVGQARLMMVYQKIFAEYNQTAAQVLLTKDTMVNDASRYNAQNTFEELLKLGTIPVVNENDTVSTSEIPYVDSFGDNDRLSAIVTALIGGDLLILLSDIDGLYTPGLSAWFRRSPRSFSPWGKAPRAAVWAPAACRPSWLRPASPRTAGRIW